jgi:glycerol-1-phosphate dehydrogenase [NAD(P)+]
MPPTRQTTIPNLVRVKSGALDRMGIYARRHEFTCVVVLFSQDLNSSLIERLTTSLASENVHVTQSLPVSSASLEDAEATFRKLPADTCAIIGLGGGKALDVAKYVAFLAHLPYLAVATSLSNDGICSPQSSLTVAGGRRSLPSAMPFGVIIDTEVCRQAPENLWLSGVGDLAAKFTAITDWKLAFHATGEPVDDFAVLLSDASIYQFLARPQHDAEGIRLLGTSLIMNGIAMSLSGSSRPASGSEHLISHALDSLSVRPRLHGLQVGIAAYIVSQLHGHNTDRIAQLFDQTNFWRAITADPFLRSEWLAAARLAPTLKHNFHTILSARNCLPEIASILHSDPRLRDCFVD